MLLQPEHNIWTEVLEIICKSNDRSSLKVCDLVCRTWHFYLQPRLMSSFDINCKKSPLNDDDIHALLLLQHMLQRVRLQYWPAQHPYVSLPLAFANITKLELYGTNFSNCGDMSTCFGSMSGNLRSLALIECNADTSIDWLANPLLLLASQSRALNEFQIQHITICCTNCACSKLQWM
jgi:hypothetical protein